MAAEARAKLEKKNRRLVILINIKNIKNLHSKQSFYAQKVIFALKKFNGSIF